MATPPAPTSASVQAAQIRSEQAQFGNALDAVVKIVLADRASADKELSSLLSSQRKLDENIGKGQNDAFVKLADLNTEYGRAVAGGNVRSVDKLKYLVEVMKLQKDINKSVEGRNDQRLDAIKQEAEVQTGGRVGDPETNRRIWELFYQDASASAYNPTLVGDINKLTTLTNSDPLSFNIQSDVEVIQQYNDKVAAAQSLTNASQVIVNAFGSDAFKNLSSAAGSGVISADVETKLRGMPDEEFARLRGVAKRLPGLTDLKERRKLNDDRITLLRKKLSGDLMVQAQSALTKFAGPVTSTKDSRISAMARLVGRPKFQDWAASNGLKIGTTRPADRVGDKDLPGYDSETNTVYVPGPDDERAVRVAMRQSTLRPERQILPRRGLEPRKVLSVEVGEPFSDATKVNEDGQFRTLDGKYVTDAELQAARDKKTTAEVSAATGGKVFKMKDESFAFISDAPDSDLESISAEDPRVKAAKFSPAVVVPDDETLGIAVAKAPAPSATRTITGRETALLPSDPEGATVIETAEGRRIVIPKEQRVSVTEASKVTPLEGETTYRGIRMPFAALRARMAGVKGEAATTPTEAEVEALPEADGVRAPAPVSAEVAGAPIIDSRAAPPAPVAVRAPASIAAPVERPTTAVSIAAPVERPTTAVSIAAPLPTQPSVAVTPGEEAGKEVRDAAGAMTGATAPQPVGVANGGSKASVPVMDGPSMKQQLKLQERLRQMRAARMQADQERMQADQDVVARAGIMPGSVNAESSSPMIAKAVEETRRKRFEAYMRDNAVPM